MGVETKLTVGRYIRFTRPNIPTPANSRGTFVNQAPYPLQVEESTGFFQKQSNIVEGSNPNPAKVHRNFQWLAWVEGAVSAVPLGSQDVLTGPMTGCWVVIYRQNGVLHVGHIGTSDQRPELTDAAKKAWSDFAYSAQRQPGDLVACFRPSDSWGAPFPPRQKDDGNGVIYGLVTRTGEMYSILVYEGNALPGVTPGPGQRATDLRRIAGIQQVTNTTNPMTLFAPKV